MTPEQLTTIGSAAALSLAVVEIIKTLLEIEDKLADRQKKKKRRRRPTSRGSTSR